MKSRTLTFVTAITLFAALAITGQLAAQEQGKEHLRYKLVDLGTFGGPQSYMAGSNGVNMPAAVNQILNNRGTAVGWADTSTLDPFGGNALGCFNPFAPDCFLPLAFQSQGGVLTDLGVLPGGDASVASWISDSGLIAGQARNGLFDPLVPGWAQVRAVLWKDGEVIDLGTLGGNESAAYSVNDRGQVVGVAVNTILDPFSFFATQLRAFLWQDGAMQDLGSLGGPESWALFVNARGQVAGFSTTNAIFNPITMSLTTDPFLWEHGTMLDLGTLGGTSGSPYGLNNRGQVVGLSDLAGDLTAHPFLWPGADGKMQDLGTLGGSFGVAEGINDAGEVVGVASNNNDQVPALAFLWKDGVMTNLGTLKGDDCSWAFHINSKSQIVGISFPCASPVFPNFHGFLWQNGFMTDLNSFAPPGSSLQTWGDGIFINDRGEIAGIRVLPDGDTNFVLHAFLLIPCGEGEDGCIDAPLGSAVVAQSRAESAAASKTMTAEEFAAFKKRIARMSSWNRVAAVSRAPYDLIASALNTYQIRINWQEASGQNQSGFNIYRCHGCSSPRTEGTKIASVGASVFAYTDGSSTSPLTEITTYTYQVTAFSATSQSGPSNASSATTKTEPAPTNLFSYAEVEGRGTIVFLRWTNNSTDDNSYFVESCTGLSCTNFSVIAQLGANATADVRGFPFQYDLDVTIRYRVRAHSPGGFSAYSNIRNQALP